ncbi:MAG TPA: stage II sporulation protein M [Anaerolineae bacterium]|nr:stage II sporulation protein M [Anaerolineae bacterium]
MTTVSMPIQHSRSWMAHSRAWLAGALSVTRREVRDTLRDWRIVAPIVILTLVFPVIMNFTASIAQDFVRRYGAQIIGERIIPFLLMIVGFFPISFSLVVALETFVGERERKSIEALLCTPLSNGQLYLGKMLAATIPSLSAAYLGISVYLVALRVFRGWIAPPELLVPIVLLTTCEAIVMVSGAVVVSSQTTSTRAANLLASFIIVPMALLVQAVSVVMFWGAYGVLWGFVAGLVVIDLLLIRMGVRLFDREELLGREFDKVDFKRRWSTLKRFFARVDPDGDAARVTLRRVYRRDVPAILGRAGGALWVVMIVTLVGAAGGWLMGQAEPVDLGFHACAGSAPLLTSGQILGNNLRAVLLSGMIGIFTLGALPVVVPLVNAGLIAYALASASTHGYDPLALLFAGILPHGIFELTGVWLASIAALRLGAVVTGGRPGATLGESWLLALADYLKVLIFVAIPFLIVASLIEIYVTPALLCAALGG